VAKQELLNSIPFSKLELMSNEKFAEALKSLDVDPPTKLSPATGTTTWAFAKTDPEMAELSEHPDQRVQALMAARLGLKSTIEETRTQRFINIGNASVTYNGNPVMPVPLKYSGAHTHRLSGAMNLNMQNLPSRGDTTLRECLLAPEGHKVLTVDAAQIEARLTAWLAGQQSLVDVFASGEDVYCSFGTKLYNRPITKKDKVERFCSKTAVLGLGFGLGAVKFCKVINLQARASGIDLRMDDAEAKRVVNLYRATYNNIKQCWYMLDKRIEDMIAGRAEGKTFGPCWFENDAIVLPSGLRLHYEGLHYHSEWQSMVYMQRGKPKRIWGGTMLENVVQALDRVAVMEAAIRIKQRTGLQLANQVHDELVYVVPEDAVDIVKDVLLEEMSRRPVWGPDLPLSAEAGVGDNYGACK
jgi:DNA polymerase